MGRPEAKERLQEVFIGKYTSEKGAGTEITQFVDVREVDSSYHL